MVPHIRSDDRVVHVRAVLVERQVHVRVRGDAVDIRARLFALLHDVLCVRVRLVPRARAALADLG